MADPIQANEVDSEPVDWLWRERIPRGMITIIGGRPDQGKGLCVSHIASDVSNTRYRDPFTGKARFGRVLYSAIEDSHAIMTRPRLEAAGANLNNIDLWRFRLPLQLVELEKHLIAGKIDCLVIDPLASHLSGGVTRHSDNIRQVTDPLTELLEGLSCACIVVEHVLKRVPTSGHAIAAIGGSSSGIVAAARMAFLFGIDPADQDRRILACVKHNICEKPAELEFELDTKHIEPVGEVPFLMMQGECVFDPVRFLQPDNRANRTGRPPDKRASAAEWLTNYLFAALVNGMPAAGAFAAVAPGPVPAGRIVEDAKQLGMTAKTLKRARTDMGVVLNPVGGGRNCTWGLPDQIISMLRGDKPIADADVPVDEAPVTAAEVDAPVLTDEDFSALLGNDKKEDKADGEEA